MKENNLFDVIVVGAGHAGCEAALASARMGKNTVIITISSDTIAQMPCNPAIGGVGKGQIVREIDAIGGEMAKAADATGIQFRMLNTKKGPAVQSPRCQSDKIQYHNYMKNVLFNEPNLKIITGMITEILINNNNVFNVTVDSKKTLSSHCVIITTGTFLNGLMHVGKNQIPGGRINEPPSTKLSKSLTKIGLKLGRLKTGTPPRLNANTVNLKELTSQSGDQSPTPFSYATKNFNPKQLDCYITYTNEKVHNLIKDNLHLAPMYSGQIQSKGPRYCPSIEDKIVKFEDKLKHQIFLEPETRDFTTIYCNGISTSLPERVQEEIVHSIKGLENAQILKYGYAVEYDFVFPTQLTHTLEVKNIKGLFFAGQINGTSGYEEAAAQGLIAGINAALTIDNKTSFIPSRTEAYIGVLLDDLVTMGVTEPYRMFTSRAEYRLVLRQDNADLRLTKYGYKLGLHSKEYFDLVQNKQNAIDNVIKYLNSKFVQGKSLAKLLRAPKNSFVNLFKFDDKLKEMILDKDVIEQIEIEVKYEGYIKKQIEEMKRIKKLEDEKLPPGLDYFTIDQLRYEAKEKLTNIAPQSLGQAMRISGITPADISILMIALKLK